MDEMDVGQQGYHKILTIPTKKVTVDSIEAYATVMERERERVFSWIVPFQNC